MVEQGKMDFGVAEGFVKGTIDKDDAHNMVTMPSLSKWTDSAQQAAL